MPQTPGSPVNQKEIPAEKRPDFVVEQSVSPKPEIKPEALPKKEQPKQAAEPSPSRGEVETPSGPAPVAPASGPAKTPAPAKNPELVRIEGILEQNLAEAFSKMDPATQLRFKQEGEVAAKKIEQAINQVKVKVKTILNIIRNWLKVIPGVNKYFIEQETKIKTDKIMAIKDQKTNART
ncbi:hypothetical protein HQ544_04690 [Candidatus Falkowbacteria bacterium]|nr:hypothetical protein [Candidatus Falkowbacteria bacterium]